MTTHDEGDVRKEKIPIMYMHEKIAFAEMQDYPVIPWEHLNETVA